MLAVGSLFSGVEGFGLGFEAAGFEVRWQCEIDKDATSVLERHYPNVKRYRDVRDVDPSVLEPVDVVTFGSPCQDLSVAGKRAGLEGGRSGLFYEAVRIIRGVRPAFALWENVPGAFSSNDGRDFGAVLAALAECGALDISWRVLDAQWFGVPQRRRRIFLVADFGGERAASVLFESEGVRGDSPSSRTAREGSAGNAQNGAGGRGVANSLLSYAGRNQIEATYIPDLSGCLDAQGTQTGQAANSDQIIAVSGEAVRDCLTAHGRRIDAESETFVVDITNGLDCGQVAGTLTTEQAKGNRGLMVAAWDEAQITSAANRSSVEYGMPAPTLNGSGLASVIGFKWQQGEAAGGLGISEDASPTLGTTQVPAVAKYFEPRVARNGRGAPAEVASALKAEAGQTGKGDAAPSVVLGTSVRRLTPREAERLMGYPDDHTRWRGDGSEIPDGPRYRMCGNGVAAPVAAWIAHRMRAALEAS